MAQVSIVLGPPRTGKSEYAVERFVAAVGQSGVDAALLLLPTARRAAEVRRQIVAEGRVPALFDARITTFPLLAQALLTANRVPAAEIGPMPQRLILRQVVQELASAGDLPYLQEVQSFTGFIEALCQLIGELKRAAVDPARFEDAIRAARLDDQRSGEVAAIYAAYQKALVELGVFDTEGLFWWARDILRDGRRRPFEELREIIVDGFWDFTTTQLDVLELLIDGVETATITLSYDNAPEVAELFEFTNHTLKRLRKTFPDATRKRRAQRQPPAKPLEHLGMRLFRRGPEEAESLPDVDRSIDLIEAPGRRREVEEIGREIKTLVLSGEAQPSEIAVVVRGLDEYAELLRITFARFGIPLYVMAGQSALRRPVVQAALAIYNAVVHDYRREDIVKLLSSNYVEFSADTSRTHISADELDRVARAARILSGREAWEKRLDVRARRLQRLLEQGSSIEDEEQEYADEGTAREELVSLEAARAYTRALFEVLDKIPRSGTLPEHATALLGLIETFNMPTRVAEAAAPEASAGDIHAFGELLRTLEELRLAGEQYVPTAARVKPVYTPGEFVEDLRTILGRTTYTPEQAAEGRVLAADAYDVRQLSFAHVFLGGLTERGFPRQRRECPFYSDAERHRLLDAGLELEPRLLRQREEILLFHSAVTRATKRLYLSYPSTDAEGKEVLSSYYVDEVRECFDGGICERRIAVSQTVPSLAKAACEEELLEGAFLHLWHPDAADRSRVAAAYNRVLACRPRAVASALAGAWVERERDSRDPPGKFDGVLKHEHILDELQRRFSTEYRFSASQFNEYGQCPMRYFFSRVLQLEELEEPSEIIDPRERGGLLHRIMRRTHESLASRKEPAKPISEDLLEQMRPAVQQIIDEQFDADVRRGTVVDEALWEIERAECKRNMALVLDKELELAGYGYVPTHFEAEYGTNSVSPLRISDDGRQVLLRGRIDRIDLVYGDGGDGEPKGFAVFDYKSGSGPRASEILSGRDFQLPIYALAARLVLDDAPGLECREWAYYRVRRPVDLFGNPSGKGELTIENCIEAAREFVVQYANRIRTGNFALPPDPGPCQFCAFCAVCRFERWRIENKRGAR